MTAARALSAVALALLWLVTPAASGAQPGVDDEHLDSLAVLRRLSLPRGVSGHEGPVVDELLRLLDELGYDRYGDGGRARPEVDDDGNLLLTVGQGERSLAFVAHLDEVGLEVTEVREDGLLETTRRGGFYGHVYQDTIVELVTANGVLPALAIASPDELGGILLDVGARSKQDARLQGVRTGDPATVKKEVLRLGPHRVAGRSFDDRVGCAALIMALSRIDVADLDRTIVFAWVVREEVGLEGADALARRLRPVPLVVFPVDTFVSSDSPLEDPRFAYAPLGMGPVLRALDNTSLTPRPMLDRVRTIARGHGIPLQTGTMGGGNDGSRFVPEGSIDCPLAWPQRCSHSRVETLDLRDLEQLAALVAAVAEDY